MTGDVHSRNSGRPSHVLTEQKRPLRSALAITAAMMLVETVRKGTDPRAVLGDANEVLISRFGIRHSTLQTEEADEPSCPTGTCEHPG